MYPYGHSRLPLLLLGHFRSYRAVLKRGLKQWKWIAAGIILIAIMDFALRPCIGQGLKSCFPGKTRWDYIELFVPVASSIVLGVIVLQLQEKYSKEREAAQKEDRAAESLQRYFDRIEALIVDRQILYLADSEGRLGKGYADPAVESARELARARTLSILRLFSGDIERKTAVVRFLVDSEILSRLRVSLKGADISNADLRWTSLVGVNLCSANLKGAKLIQADMGNIDKVRCFEGEWVAVELEPTLLLNANMESAELLNANLKGARLQNADLSSAILTDAKMQGTDLSSAKLAGANLTGVNLTGAILCCADLSGADLSYAVCSEADLRDVKWDAKTLWPDSASFLGARNIAPQLKARLGLA